VPRRNLIWILVVVLAATVATWLSFRRSATYVVTGEDGIAAVREAHRRIREDYVDEIDDRALQERAIQAMVDVLDDRSIYVPPSQASAFRRRMAGSNTGYGLHLARANGAVVIVAPAYASPAHRAGLLPGDRILAVDGRPIGELAADELGAILHDPARGGIELTVVGREAGETTVRLARKSFDVETVTGLYRAATGSWQHVADRDTGLVYVRIEEFVDTTAGDIQKALREAGEIKGVILDLRDNPGGVLSAAVATADLLLSSGPIVTVYARDRAPQSYTAQSRGTYPPFLLAVLVNKQTASAAEIVAGALKQNRRAVLIGQPTFGKSSVQTMVRLPDHMGQLSITTSRYAFGPPADDETAADAAARIVDEPIAPVVYVAVDAATHERLLRQRLVLALGPEAWPDVPNGPTTQPVGALPAYVRRHIERDPQLSVALRLLTTPGAAASILELDKP